MSEIQRPLTGNSPIERRVREIVRDATSILDVGPGIKPYPANGAYRLCVEPHDEYARYLVDRGYDVLQVPAPKALLYVGKFSLILMLDVIEHMEKHDGILALDTLAGKGQIAVFTPLGFVPQEGDAWGMNGDYWQKHRSGWMPEDFPGWEIIVDKTFHGDHGAFLALSGG